jgi:hypothetical protein
MNSRGERRRKPLHRRIVRRQGHIGNEAGGYATRMLRCLTGCLTMALALNLSPGKGLIAPNCGY